MNRISFCLINLNNIHHGKEVKSFYHISKQVDINEGIQVPTVRHGEQPGTERDRDIAEPGTMCLRYQVTQHFLPYVK